MSRKAWSDCIEMMQNRANIRFEDGLSGAEFDEAEKRFNVSFPQDLREFLGTALPVSPKFPNWRNPDCEKIEKRIAWPLDGILFDVEHNGFWMDAWPSRPGTLQDALAVATRMVKQAPVLIPVYAHRMMPCAPAGPGNPVYSVWQTDIIIYGSNLQNYLEHEFHSPSDTRYNWNAPEVVREIPFWHDIVYGRGFSEQKTPS